MKPRTKITVEECPTLDVRSLPDAGFFDPSVKQGRLRLQRAGREIGGLDVATGEDGLHLQYDVFLGEGTRTRVSSVRAVVRTPAINKGERVCLPAAISSPASSTCRPERHLPLSGLPQQTASSARRFLSPDPTLSSPNLPRRLNRRLKSYGQRNTAEIGLYRSVGHGPE